MGETDEGVGLKVHEEAGAQTTRRLVMALVLCAALVHAFVTGAWLLLPLVVVGVVLASFLRRPFAGNRQNYLVSVLVAAVAGWLLTRLESEAGGGPRTIHVRMVPALVLGSMLLLLFEQRIVTLATQTVCCHAAVLMCGGVRQASMPRASTVAMFVGLALVLVLLPRITHRYTATGRRRGAVPGAMWAGYLVAFILAAALYRPLVNLSRGAYRVLNAAAARTIGSMLLGTTGRRYSAEMSPRAPLFDTAGSDERVVLRVRSETEPGYLRGWALAEYSLGTWKPSSRRMAMFGVGPAPHARRYYDRPDAVAAGVVDAEELEFYPASGLYTDTLFLPANAARVAVSAEALETDVGGSVFGDALPAGPYAAYRIGGRGGDAYDGPRDPDDAREAYLQVPAEYRKRLETIASAALGDLPDGPERLPEAERRLKAFFAATCSYDLTVPAPPLRDDPTLYFLETSRRGCCRHFASAAVLLLRVRGIPARVVKGFVCNEAHPSGRYWVVRARTAHAWAEAFDEAQRRWVMVEMTPSEGVPAVPSGFGPLAALGDYLAMMGHRLAAAMSGFDIRAITGTVAEALAALADWLVLHPVRGPCLAGIIALLALLKRIRARSNVGAEMAIDRERRRLIPLLRAAERKLARHFGKRNPWETPREWVERNREADESDRVRRALAFLDRYESCRYGPTTEVARDDSDVPDIVETLNALVRAL